MTCSRGYGTVRPVAGRRFASGSNVLVGYPAAPGTYTFSVTATNGVLPNATAYYTVVVTA